MSKTWKTIPNFSNYSCSKGGKIKNKSTGQIRDPKTGTSGYLTLTLKNDSGKHVHRGVHRFIAETWIENPENKPTVNHKNKKRTDNRVSNLEWSTHSEQGLHRTKEDKGNIRIKSNYGIWMCDKETGEKIKYFDRIADAEVYLGLKNGCGNIVTCTKGKIKHVYGYKWKYDDNKFYDKTKDLDGEAWKVYRDTYYISNHGRIRNNNIFLSTYLHDGYVYCSIKGKSFRVHRLVAEKFITNPKPNEYDVVNHKDGDKQNNHHTNLEWCTHGMNANHVYEEGLKKSIKKVINFDKNFNILGVYNTAFDASKALNVHVSNICRACKGESNIYDKNKKQLFFKRLEPTDDLKNKKVGLTKLPIKPKKKNREKVIRKKINVYDKNGKLVETCKTRVEVAKKYNVHRNTVTSQCNGNHQFSNTDYRFSYAD